MNRFNNKEFKSTASQHGSIVIFFVIMLPILLATMGLALDVGKFYVIKSELQNAADACALAAAYELDGTATQFTRANTAGLNLAAQNKVHFQKEALAGTIVEFSTSATGGYSGAASAPTNAGFVRCNVSKPNVPTWFIHLVGIGSQTIPATAVASNVPGQSTCAIPIAVCSADLPPGTAVGTWVTGVLAPGSANNDSTLSGNFKWVDFTPKGGGANELAQILSGELPGSCNLPSNNEDIGASGFKASLRGDYNTRFGIFKDKANAPYITDYSGFGYYDFAQQNRYYGDYLSKRAVNEPYKDIVGIDIDKKNIKYLTKTELAANGTNRRVALAPVVDCGTLKVQAYACMFLLHPLSLDTAKNFKMYLEYLGNPSTQATPCGNSSGLAGGGNGIGPRVTALIQ